MKKEEQERLETQSIPLRNYLMQHVMPTLTEGLIEVSKVKPEDAIDYLVSSLVYPILPLFIIIPHYRLSISSNITHKLTEL